MAVRCLNITWPFYGHVMYNSNDMFESQILFYIPTIFSINNNDIMKWLEELNLFKYICFYWLNVRQECDDSFL